MAKPLKFDDVVASVRERREKDAANGDTIAIAALAAMSPSPLKAVASASKPVKAATAKPVAAIPSEFVTPAVNPAITAAITKRDAEANAYAAKATAEFMDRDPFRMVLRAVGGRHSLACNQFAGGADVAQAGRVYASIVDAESKTTKFGGYVATVAKSADRIEDMTGDALLEALRAEFESMDLAS